MGTSPDPTSHVGPPSNSQDHELQQTTEHLGNEPACGMNVVAANEEPAQASSLSKSSPSGPENKAKRAKKQKADSGNGKSAGKQKEDNNTPKSERDGSVYFHELHRHVTKHKGQFLRDESGSLHLILGGRRVRLDFDYDNLDLANLFLAACHVTTLSQGARAAIQRLQVSAYQKSRNIRLRRFSAVSADDERVYIPIQSGQLLRISKDNIETVVNGNHGDGLWVEHPYGEPLKYSQTNPETGLALFEKLLVQTQACKQSAMCWFVAMQEGLFPFIRDLCPARFITVHIGPTQQGKTSGAQRFTLLHGLGEVKGDCSVATLSNEGDIGLLVMDNKEQANLTQGLIDFCLFLATGGEYGRSSPDGKNRTSRGRGRPVGVITTIEGMSKVELQARTVVVEFRVQGEKRDRAAIEREIRERRHEISSALIPVLQKYLQIRQIGKPTPNPIPEFRENFQALADLLRAYGEVAKKPPEWAEQIIADWAATISSQPPEEDELEYPVSRVLNDSAISQGDITREQRTFQGRRGKLYITTCGELLTRLQSLSFRELVLPKTPEGLGRRLRGRQFRAFEVLDEESAPELAELKRTATTRPIGFFIRDDAMTANGSK